MKETALSVLVFRGDSGLFVAVCLEYDVFAQARSQDEAFAALERTLVERRRIAIERGEKPFERARRAPAEYWQRYESARRLDRRALETSTAEVRAAE